MTRSLNPLADGFDQARAVADAVLFEGYVLYPYRASAAKNRVRWQFGVLVPPAWAGTGGEHDVQRTECLLEPREGDRLHAELRFLRVRRRTVERLADDGTFTEVSELELPDRVLVPWDEGTEERVLIHAPLAELTEDQAHARAVTFDLPSATSHESVTDEEGRTVGRLVRRGSRVKGDLRPQVEELPGPYGAVRLSVTVRNITPVASTADTGREAALPHSMVGTHLLLGVPGGRFLSMTDPPEWARPAVDASHNDGTWPVLAGPPGGDDIVLSSPIILEDHPALADESPGPLYDATEIDEILSLRTAALTEREKREARGTDARAAEVVDLVDSMPEAIRERLHGAIRGLRDVTGDDDVADSPAAGLSLPDGSGHPWWDPAQDPEADRTPVTVVIDGETVGAGSRVLLTPGARRSDAQDAFLFGRHATVETVVNDLDGETHLAVVVDDDPGTDVRRDQGRFLYFKPDEVAPLKEAP
ncbi:hypothetical protein ACFVT5_41685 [Streptomyces sp. NPDC058001]|uniref:hypothetical protein n=1 Tax=Streptomyces sp. NPDC058001 TaxID=3346300 RepID=UPI0036E6EBC0